MHVERFTVSLTTNASGAATGYTPPLTGMISHIKYVKTDFADTVDFTVTSETALEGLWTQINITASTTRAPRQPTHDGVGVASLYAGSGEPVEAGICLANDRVKCVVANGGDTKTGTFIVVLIGTGAKS